MITAEKLWNEKVKEMNQVMDNWIIDNIKPMLLCKKCTISWCCLPEFTPNSCENKRIFVKFLIERGFEVDIMSYTECYSISWKGEV